MQHAKDNVCQVTRIASCIHNTNVNDVDDEPYKIIIDMMNAGHVRPSRQPDEGDDTFQKRLQTFLLPFTDVTSEHILNAAHKLARTKLFSDDIFTGTSVNVGNLAFTFDVSTLKARFLDFDDTRFFRYLQSDDDDDINNLSTIYSYVIGVCLNRTEVTAEQAKTSLLSITEKMEAFDTLQ